MEIWQRNLAICCAVTFIVSVGTSQMAPILPLYICELGIEGQEDMARWSGIVFGCSFVTLAVFSPIWGRVADRYGRKLMILRATGWLGVIMIALGLAQNVWQLVGLRLLQGAMSGLQSAVIPLLAAETPRDKSGWAMSMYFAAQVTGGLLGPVIGGGLSEAVGYRNSFFVTGALCLLGFAAALFVRETKQPALVSETGQSTREMFLALPRFRMTMAAFLVTFLMYFSITCMQPVLTVYVDALAPDTEHLAVVAGIVFSCSGVASMLFASKLGHLSDQAGPHRVLVGSLLLAGLVSFPQGCVTTAWELGALRFVHGIAMAGMIPAINDIIRLITPTSCTGRIYGFNQSAQYVGTFAGAFAGGQLTACLGFAHMFFIVGLLLLGSAVWCRMHLYVDASPEK
ncbi:MAG: MFS transporter [Selenomonas sp.]|uniref:MFS transporter n=1 Tax=Selenomonas sp. TaxID=2053611 RepID=UPI0025E7664F|nr:MFS transporter [Selenomonas sp.]MCI6232503.1 MFS transporter [Selenomonas sp.]